MISKSETCLLLACLLMSPHPWAQADVNPSSGQKAVSALGRIEPQHGIVHLSVGSTPEAISGALLQQLLVQPGDDVAAGQLLATTDATLVSEAHLKVATAALQQSERAAIAAQSRAEEACVLAEVSAHEAQRRADLLQRKLASEEEAEQAQGEAKARAASCTAAHATARIAESGIEVAQATVALREAEWRRTRVVAPFAGRVLDTLVQPGELIQLEGVLQLGRVQQMVAVAEVYETDIRRVRIGQRAEIRSDALPDMLTGTVDFIALKVAKQDEIGTDPAARKDARIIEVDIVLDQSDAVAALTHLQVEILINP